MTRRRPAALVVDRDSAETRSLVAFLRREAFDVAWSHDGESAINALDRLRPEVLVAALHDARIDGLAVLARARARHPEVCAVLIAAPDDTERAVEALRRGASDTPPRPVHLGRLLAIIERGLAHQALVARLHELEEQLDDRHGAGGLTGRSRAIHQLREQIRHAATLRAPILIEGERGTGKGLVARVIHTASPRRGERFVWVDCEAIAPDRLEVELFGREPAGAGATGEPGELPPARGSFELAEGGTLFLEEVGALPKAVQLKLVRAIQDRAYERAGGTRAVRADVRVVAGSRRDLAAEVAAGRFREDLLERLRVVRVVLPPLRERREDIPLLVDAFLRAAGRQRGRKIPGVTRGVLERLMAWGWPGNVGELKQTIEAMALTAGSRRALDVSALPEPLRVASAAEEKLEVAVGMTVEEVERHLLEATLRRAGGNKPTAAAMLGIALRTLYRKIDAYGLREPPARPAKPKRRAGR